ncbi:hypothetical protein ACHWQZ_G018093 [Mnemiopsis leidyi]
MLSFTSSAIRLLYDTAKSSVQTSDGLTDFFETLIGVLQGDILAPFLFIIVLDYILRNCMSPDYGLIITPRQSRRIPAVTVTDLDFADDLALLSNTIQEAQSLLNDLEVAAEKVGLCMNSSKTEFMTINIDSEKASIKSKGGHSLEHVDDFKYLGSYIADSKQDFNTRKGMAWTACIKLQKVCTSGISEHLKVKFFKACDENKDDALYSRTSKRCLITLQFDEVLPTRAQEVPKRRVPCEDNVGGY